ncbi:MAG: hypothetical protein AB7R89_16095 [Dehalococcoidia bacterium]
MDAATRSASRFAWECLGSPLWSPPADPGPDTTCYLCAGPTDGAGWPVKLAIPVTFTNVNRAADPTSRTVCQACVYTSATEPWKAYVAVHPAMGLKDKHPLSWRSYSHLFSAAGHECPSRSRWREILLDPPAPPFLAVVAESGQKHILFRAAVAYDGDVFPVQVEEERVYLDRARFAAGLPVVEALLRLGFSRDAIRGNVYPPHLVLKHLAAWKPLSAATERWRIEAPDELRLALFCAQGPKKEE